MSLLDLVVFSMVFPEPMVGKEEDSDRNPGHPMLDAWVTFLTHSSASKKQSKGLQVIIP